ncbi:MAG: PIG-L family deacetylase [Candidatus Hydrogenedentota bacterium]
MVLNQSGAELFVPDGMEEGEALARTTHLAIGAHADDLEIMAYHGILACFQRSEKWFTGVVVTNGAGSSRTGVYAEYSDEDMVEVRRVEQKKAAVIGEYAAQFLLDHPSGNVKSGAITGALEDLRVILEATKPEVVYTHNFADKHDTHVGVTLNVIEAIRSLPEDARPKHVYGCEVWRDLDWMVDSDKVAFDVSDHVNLHGALVGVFDSQIAGGKRYDLATLGRCRAHATYHESHGVDATTGMTFAMDLMPLVEDVELDVLEFTQDFIRQLAEDVTARFGRVGG